MATKAAQAYSQIERMIVRCDLEPGSLISESEFMELTGLGRTPVREALQRLARNRMVEIHPNKGVLVPQLSGEAQLRMLELRRPLEILAVRLAAERANGQMRDEMAAMVGRLRTEEFRIAAYLDTVKETHELIVRGARNQYLVDAIAPVQGLSRRFWFHYMTDEQAGVETGRRLHAAILQAVLDRNADAGELASIALNDYLTGFTREILGFTSK